MAIPLERESKMWGLLYASDFNRLMAVFVGDAFAFMGLFILGGLAGALILFFSVLVLGTFYFVVKGFWPEKHFQNVFRYNREPKLYASGKEESEVES